MNIPNLNPVDKLLTSIGALSEVCGTIMNGLMRNGFAREEALYLTGEIIKTMLTDVMNK